MLNERELTIIAERRLRDDGATLEALGERLGISKERVRQIENRALEKLQIGAGRAASRISVTPDGLNPSWSVMILTLSPAETRRARRQRVEHAEQIELAVDAHHHRAKASRRVWPGFTVTTRMRSGLSAAFSRALKQPEACADRRAPRRRASVLASGAAVSRR